MSGHEKSNSSNSSTFFKNIIFWIPLFLLILMYSYSRADAQGILPSIPITIPDLLNLTPTPTPQLQQPTPVPTVPPVNTQGSTQNSTIIIQTPQSNTTQTSPQGGTSNITGSINRIASPVTSIKSPESKIILIPQDFPNGIVRLPNKDVEVIFTKNTFGQQPQGWVIVFPQVDTAVVFNFISLLHEGLNGSEVEIKEKLALEKPVGDDTVRLIIPENTTLTVGRDKNNSKFDGKILGFQLAPIANHCGAQKPIEFALEIGRLDRELLFDQPVQLTFSGKAEKLVGYCLDGEVSQINLRCSEGPSLIRLIKEEGECYQYEGEDLHIQTNHLTQFVVFKNQKLPLTWILGGSASLLIIIMSLLLLRLRMQGSGKIDDYVSSIVHDLRTPLTAIKGYLSMILEGKYGTIKESARKPLTTVAGSAQQLSTIVNDLLDVSKLKAGKLQLHISEFTMEQVVSDTIIALDSIAKAKGLTLESKNIDSVSVRADSEKVKQILTNLIGNALKFTEKGGVTISTDKKDKKLEIFVNDTGVGMPKDEQVRLFEKFSQLDNQSSKTPGTGLGLYISRVLAKKMDGDLWLENSTQGSGSTFAFSLPLANSREKVMK